MALLPSIMELFSRPAPPAPLSPQQKMVADSNGPTTPTPSGSELSNTTVPSGATPTSDGSNPAFPATKNGESSPLEGYKDLWQTPAKLSNVEALVPSITADPTAMLKAAQNFDFTTGMSPELLQKATSGDSSALAEIINTAVRAGYAQAATASVAITKAALTQQAQRFETDYAPNMLRNESIGRAVDSTVALASDPAVAPIVNALRTQLTAKFPTATPDQIAEHVNNYLGQFAQKAIEANGGRVQPKSELEQRNASRARTEQDWSVFFDTPTI